MILQQEKVEVFERITDSDTGELTDATKVAITPEIDSTSPQMTTLGNLKAKLSDSIYREKISDDAYANSKILFSTEQEKLQNQIDQVI